MYRHMKRALENAYCLLWCECSWLWILSEHWDISTSLSIHNDVSLWHCGFTLQWGTNYCLFLWDPKYGIQIYTMCAVETANRVVVLIPERSPITGMTAIMKSWYSSSALLLHFHCSSRSNHVTWCDIMTGDIINHGHCDITYMTSR